MGFEAEYKYSIWMSKDTTKAESDDELEAYFREEYDSFYKVWGEDADDESVEAYYRFQEFPDSCRTASGAWQATITTRRAWQRYGTRIDYDVIAKNAKSHGVLYEVAECTETACYRWKRRVYGPDGKAWYDERQEFVNGGYEEWTHPEMPGRPTLDEIAAENMPAFLIWRAATGEG